MADFALYDACVLPIAYWGNVHSYALMLQSAQVWVEGCENYQKQTYRTRCSILGSNGVLDLTVPVDHQKSPTQGIRDIQISNRTPWQLMHWRALVAAYQNSPYFEYYQDDLARFYHQTYNHLWDYLWQLQDFAWECIGYTPTLHVTAEYLYPVSGMDDYRAAITPKSAHYVETAAQETQKHPYYQVFAHKFGFVPNLSILDLIFNMGPESLRVLQSCPSRIL